MKFANSRPGDAARERDRRALRRIGRRASCATRAGPHARARRLERSRGAALRMRPATLTRAARNQHKAVRSRRCATPLKTIRQILFVPPAPFVWAEHLGAFARHGVEVKTTQTLSSEQIGRGLAERTWDIGIGVFDEVIAWNSEHNARLQLIAQLERSTVMRFCVVPSCASLADAAGNVIVVDSTTHGFALVLYRALAQAGINWRRCRFDCVGG